MVQAFACTMIRAIVLRLSAATSWAGLSPGRLEYVPAAGSSTSARARILTCIRPRSAQCVRRHRGPIPPRPLSDHPGRSGSPLPWPGVRRSPSGQGARKYPGSGRPVRLSPVGAVCQHLSENLMGLGRHPRSFVRRRREVPRPMPCVIPPSLRKSIQRPHGERGAGNCLLG